MAVGTADLVEMTGIENRRDIFQTFQIINKTASYRYFLTRYYNEVFHLFCSFLYL